MVFTFTHYKNIIQIRKSQEKMNRKKRTFTSAFCEEGTTAGGAYSSFLIFFFILPRVIAYSIDIPAMTVHQDTGQEV